MKVDLSFEFFKATCWALADRIAAECAPDELVAVSRGGFSAAHLIGKRLKLPVGVFFPHPPRLAQSNDTHKKLVFIEDLIAEGRTYEIVKKHMNVNHTDVQWWLVPFLIDAAFDETSLVNVPFYGMKSPLWMVFPYEDADEMVEGDRGFFRDGTDAQGRQR